MQFAETEGLARLILAAGKRGLITKKQRKGRRSALQKEKGKEVRDRHRERSESQRRGLAEIVRRKGLRI